MSTIACTEPFIFNFDGEVKEEESSSEEFFPSSSCSSWSDEDEPLRSNETFEEMLNRGASAAELAQKRGTKDSPYYVYLIRSPKPQGNHKNPFNTHVGKGKNPIRKTIQHNLGLLDSKSTRQGRPGWEIVTFLGPFRNKRKSVEFREEWRTRRKFHRRMDYLFGGHFKSVLSQRQRKRVRVHVTQQSQSELR